MLDIQFIRDNPDLVKEKSGHKGYQVDVDKLLQLDGKRRQLVQDVEKLRGERNALADQLKKGKPSEEEIKKGRELKEKVASLEKELEPINEEFTALLKSVPNMPLDDVPVAASEDENKVVKEWGTKKEFDFKPRTHWEIAEARGLIDKERAAKVAGSRFAYIKGGLAELQFALLQFVFRTLTDEVLLEKIIKENNLSVPAKAFIPILPPAMVKTEVFDAMDRLEPRDDRYKVGEDEDDLWLQGSAEHVIGPMYMNEILPAGQLPIRYVGYASSFRREAGTYGKDTEGIIRMHQFDKAEMETFCMPETGLDEHKLHIALQEYMVQQLDLPYRLIAKCTADIGKPNARGIDIDTWMPGQGKYKETHTADYMTDYQTRRLKTRVRKPDGSTELAHTADATAFAFGRTLVAIIENNQTKDGHIGIPEVLRPFMGGREFI